MTKKQTTKSRKQLHQHVKHALVPHRGNQYRPHLIRWQGVSIVLAVIVALQFVYGVILQQGGVLGRVSNIDSTQLVEDTNRERERDGLEPLVVNQSLAQAAQLKANDMFTNDYWAHVSPTGVTPWQWLGDVSYSYDQAGENLAKNYPDAQSTVDAWMASETHRANIMNGNYTEVGFAVVDGQLEGSETTLVVAFYGAPRGTVGAVSGAQVAPSVFAAPVADGVGNPIVYFGSAIRSLTPVTITSILLLVIVAAIALAAHHFRTKLPKNWRKSWRVHHGMYTFLVVSGVAVLLVLASGGGQI